MCSYLNYPISMSLAMNTARSRGLSHRPLHITAICLAVTNATAKTSYAITKFVGEVLDDLHHLGALSRQLLSL
jgi:hypothetical protein